MVRRFLSLSTLVAFTGAFAAPQYMLRAEAPVRPGEITFGIGVTDDEVTGSFDTLFPLAVPKNGLLFLNPKLTGGDELDPRVSIGFGYRHLFEGPKIIVGGNIFYDSFDTVHDHRINQLGLGAEVLTRWVDFRANFYLPEQDRRTIAKTQTVDVSRKATSSSQALGPRTTGQSLAFQGNNILQTTTGLNESITTINLRETETTGFWERYEAGMRGGDAEVGVLIPGLDRYADVRIFGGYYFYENDFGKDLNGFKGRLEVRAVPAVTFDAMYYQDEEVIGSNWFYGVRVTAPFDLANLSNGRSPFAGFAESFKPKNRDNEREMFARRLTENVMRTSRVTTSESKFIKVREEKEVYEGNSTYVTSTPFSSTIVLTLAGVAINVAHVNNGVGGTGTFETPFNSLTAANADPAKATRNIVYVHSGTTFAGQTFTLAPNQRLLGEGGGNTHFFTSDQGTFTLPAVNGTALARPTGMANITLPATGASEVSNFDITGAGGPGITATTAGTGNINRVAITGGSDGIFVGPSTGTVNITGTTITNPTGNGINIVAGSSTVNFGSAVVDPTNAIFGPSTITQNAGGTAAVNVGAGHTGAFTQAAGSTITSTTGTGLSFDDADGTYTFNGTTTLNGNGLGVNILNDSDGAFNFNGLLQITNTTGRAVNIDGSPSGTFTFLNLDINQAVSEGVLANNSGLLTITNGAIDNVAGDGISATNTALNITGTTIGTAAAVTGDGIQVVSNDATARTVTLANNTLGNPAGPLAIGGRGIAINGAGPGLLTANITGNNSFSTSHALELTSGATLGSLVAAVDGNTLQSTGAGSFGLLAVGVNLNTTQNTAVVTSLNGNTVTPNGVGGGMRFENITFDADGVAGGAVTQVNGGATNIGANFAAPAAADRVQGNGLAFINPTGSVNFTTLNIANNAGDGLLVVGASAAPNNVFALSGGGSGTINTTGGAALNLDPLFVNLTFGNVTSTNSPTSGVILDGLAPGSSVTITNTTVTGSTGDGIFVRNASGATLNFGTTNVTNAGGDGIDLTNAGTANVTFGTTNINGFGAGNAGVNFTGSDVTATFGVTTITNGGNGVGIDLTSSQNNRTITFATGSNINNVAIGVRLSNGVGTSANSNFTFGDGNAANGLGSFINAPTTVSALHLNSASGTYNFLDVNFTGSAIFPPPVGGALYFVNGTGSGTGDGSSIANAATIATATIHSAANLGTTNTYVLVNNAGTIDLGAATLTLGANDRLDGFGNGNSFSSGVPINVLGFGAAITDANGAATLTGTGPLVTLANANVAQNLIFSGGTTSFGGTGITDFTFTGNTLTGGSTAAFAFTNAAGTISINNSTITAGGQLLTLNGGAATVQMTRGTGTSLTGTGLTIQNTTGGSVAVTDAALATNGNTAVTLNGNAATVTLTNLAITRTAGDTAFNIDATTPSTATITVNGTSTINNVAGAAFTIGAGARNITAGTVAITNNNTTTGSVVSVAGQSGGTISLGNVTNSGTTATNVISTTGQTGGTLSFGTVAITGFGNAGTDTAVNLAGTAGTVSFTDLDITTTNGAGLNVGGITFAPGSSPTISATGATALTMNGTTLSGGAAIFASVSATNTAGNAGISLTNITGATTLTTIAISNAGAPGIGFDNADTVTINGGSINGTGGGFGAAFINTAFTLNSLSLGAAAATLNDGIYVEMSDGIARTSSIDGLTTNLVAGTAVNFNNFGAGVQTFTLANSTLNSTGSLGLRVLINAAGGNVNVAANNNTITQGGLLMDAQGAPGTLTVTSFLNNNVLKASNSGMEFRQVTFDADLGTAGFQQVSGGNTTIGNALATTDVTGFGLRLFNSKGNLGFGTLNIYNDTGTGLYAAPLPGDSLTLSNTAGVISTTNGAALDITRVALNSTFTSVSSTNAFTNGITLDTVSGTAVLGAVNVTNATGSGLLVQGSSANVSASSVTIDQTGTNGITLSNNTGSFTVTGATNITRASADGINLTGLNANPTVTFGATTIGTAALAGFGNANVGINFAGANVTASFGVTSIQNGGNGTGIDLSSTLGNRTITFAKTSSITNVNIGVQLSSSGTVATTANANFTFGDGEGVTDKASTISATTTVAAIGLAAGSGTYNFLDVNFTGTAGFPAAVGATFVSSTAVNGAGDGSFANPFSVADADALVAAGLNFAFLDGTYNFGTLNGGLAFTLSASQTLAGLDNGHTFGFGLVQPVNVQGDFGALGGTVTRGSPGSGVGGAITITNTTGTSLFTFAGSTATIEDITVAGSASNTSFFNATGVTGLTLQRVTMGGLPATGSALSFTNLTAGAVNIQNNTLTGNAGSLVSITGGAATYNIVAGTGTLTGRGLSITGTTGGSVQVTGAALATTGNTAITLNGNAAPITFTNLAITRTAGDTAFNIDATLASTGAITIDGASTLDSTAGPAFLIGAGGRNINASALNFTNTGTTAANVISSTGQTGGTISFGNVGITGFNNAAGTAVGLLGTGTVTFADLDIAATAGIGLATGGIAFNPGSSATINTLAGAALSMTGTAASGGFTSVSSTGSAGFGIDLNGVTGTLGLGNVSVTNATTAGLRMTGSSAAVTAGTLTVTTAPTGLVFGTNAGSFTATGATNLTGITGTGINANAATGSYTFADLTIGFSGAGRGIDLRGSNVTTFTAGTTSITGNDTAGSIAIDLSGSLFPGGQPVSGTPNIQLGTVGAQTATISNVGTGVKLGEAGNSAHSFFRYGNQTSGSSIDVIVGGLTIDTTNLTTTTAFQEGRYEFTGVTYGVGDKASFELGSTNFIFVSSAGTGSQSGANPTSAMSIATFLATQNTAVNLANKTVVFVNDGASINLGATTLNAGTNTSLLGFGNGASVTVPGGVIPLNVIGTFTPGGGTFSDAINGAATVISSTNTVTLSTGNTLGNFVLGNATQAVVGTNFGTLTINGMVINTNGRALNLTTGTLAGTGFNSVTSTGGLTGVTLIGVGGSMSFGSTTISGTTNQGIFVNTSTASLNFGNTSVTGNGAGTEGVRLENNPNAVLTFGTLTLTNSGGRGFLHTADGGTTNVTGLTTITNAASDGILIDGALGLHTVTFADVNSTGSGARGVALTNNTTAVTFADLDISPDAGQTALEATGNTGLITATSGTIVATGAGSAIVITGPAGLTPLNLTLTSVSSAGGTNGISLTNTSGTANFGLGALSGATGATFNVSGGTAVITYNGTVTQNSAANAVNVTGKTGGSVTFGGLVTANTSTATAINLTTNGTSAINFTGGLDIDTTSGTGFIATGGAGTITITGAGNTVQTSTGRILNWNGANIGASGVTFASLQATGIVPNDAILLDNVDGVGNTFNGGNITIAGTSGAASDGIRISAGSTANFTFASATISNTGDDAIDSGGLNGAITFTTVNLNGMAGAGIELNPTAGTGAFAVNGGTIGNTDDPAGITVDINGGNSTITIAASITKTTVGDLIEITGRTGGTVTLSGNLSATGLVANGIDINNNTGGTIDITGGTKTLTTGANTAVNLATNTGATINFTGGGLAITTTSGTGFGATGGGTINVTGAGNTIDSTTGGTALSLSGITIGGSGITFDSITANGASANSGIVLNGTGAGTLTVTGTTTVDSRSASSIKIDNTVNATFGTTNITNRGGIGIDIDTHAGALAFGATTISGAGGGTAAIDNTGSTGGSVTFASTTISGSTGTAITLTNNAGTFTSNGGAITNSTGNEIVVSGGAGNVTIAAGITNSTGRSVNITGRTGGTVDISGSINDTGTGINVANNTGGTIVFSNATKNLNTGVNQAVTLATNTGATINFTGGGLAITTTSGTGFGATGGGTINVTGAGNTIDSTTGGTALSLSGITIGGSGITFDSITANGASANSGIVLNGTGAGTLTVTGTTTVDSRSVASIKIDNTVNATFGVTNITNRGGIGIDIDTHAGALAFGATTISGAGGATAAIDNTGSTGGSVTFTSTTISGSGGAGVSLTNNAGTFTSNGGAISGSTGNEVTVSGGTGAITIAANLTNTGAARSVSIDNHETGNVTFSGTINDTGLGILVQNSNSGTIAFSGTTKTLNTGANTAVTLTSNTGGTINFTGGNLDIDTTSGGGFNATGGGTVTVQGTGNTINSGTGTALNIANTTIDAAGVTFQSISSNGAVSGIILNNTGTAAGNGGLTVTGNSSGNGGGTVTVNAVGTAATVTAPVIADLTGGTIQNSTGAGISLNNTKNVSLTRMRILNSGTDGINVTNINGFTLNRSFISDSAGVAGDRGIEMGDFATGTAVNGAINITNSTIGATPHDNFGVGIGSGTSTWNITGSVFEGSVLNSGFNFEIRNATVSSFLIDGSVFRNQFADGLQMQPASGVNATLNNVTIQNSSFLSNNIGIDLNHDGTGTTTYRVLNNTFLNQTANSINLFSSAVQAPATGGTLNARFVGNVIGDAAVFASGGGIGIRVNINGGAHANVLIDNNTIRQIPNGRGIEIISRNGTGGLDVTVTNNFVNTDFVPTVENGGFSLANIFIQSNVVTVANSLRADVRGNTVPNTAPTGELVNFQLALIETGASTFQLVDNGAASANATAEVQSQNTGSAGANAGVSLIAGPITLPPMLFAAGSASASSSNAELDQTSLNMLGNAAISLWAATGLTAEQTALLQTITFGIADLAPDRLGEASGTQVFLSSVAAGNYWFIDSTPLDNSEFTGSGLTLQAISTGEAAGRVDALSVLLHEIGHVLGLDDAYGSGIGGPLMEGHLELSERLLPMSLDLATP